MLPADAGTKSQRMIYKIIALKLLVIAPLIYIYVAREVSKYREPVALNAGTQVLLYILLVLAVVSPTVLPTVEKATLISYKKGRTNAGSTLDLYQRVSVVKYAVLGATYIYGFLMVILTWNPTYLWYFYPIGIIWTIIRWPTEEKYREFERKLKEV